LGLVPSWAKDLKLGVKTINARAETVVTKPSFRNAFKKRRSLVPASGYFEWKGVSPNKQPYFIHDPAGDLLMFAGLWEGWRPPQDEEWMHTFTIITGEPSKFSVTSTIVSPSFSRPACGRYGWTACPRMPAQRWRGLLKPASSIAPCRRPWAPRRTKGRSWSVP